MHAATGASVTSSTGIANPLPYWLTLGAYNNRPEAGTTAYTQIPLLLREYRHLQFAAVSCPLCSAMDSYSSKHAVRMMGKASMHPKPSCRSRCCCLSAGDWADD